MADEEDFSDDLQQLDDEGAEGLPPEEHDELEEGTDASKHAGGSEEGDDEPGAERQAGAATDQSQGAEHGKVSRGQARQARLANELRETKEKALAHERELAQLKAQMQQMQQPRGETPEQRQHRLDSMTTEERLTTLWQESEQRAQQQRAYDQFLYNDRADAQEYAARAAADKRAEKYKDEVEQTLRAFRSQGVNPKRSDVYYYVLGRKVAEAKGKQAKGQAEGVARRQAANRTTPATTGGDVGRSARGRSLEQKLDGVLL